MYEKYRSEIEQLQIAAPRLGGEAADEDAFVAALEALLSRVITEAPAELDALLNHLVLPPLRQARHQQVLAYYRGLALGLREHYHDALTAFGQLLAQPALDDHIKARTLNSRAIFQRITGQLQAAVDSYQLSLALWTALDDPLNIGKVQINLGILAYQLQEYSNAEARLNQAATIFTTLDEPSRLASVQNELGLLYRDQGRWPAALACFDQAATQRRREGASNGLGIALNNRGEVLLLQGEFAAAATVFTEALQQMTTRVYVVDVHLNLGLMQLATGNLAAAHAEFTAARAVALTIERRDLLALVHYRLGDCLLRMGEPQEAYRALEDAVAIIEATREPMTSEGLKISLLGRWQQIYEALVLLALELGDVEVALLWAERARARAFAELVTARRAEEQTPAHQPDPATDDDAVRWAIDQLRAGLPVGHQVLCYFTTGVLDRNEPFLRLLPADHPLRPYLLTPPRTLLFLISRDRVHCLTCPVDPNAFTSNAQRQSDRSRFFAPRVISGLYQMLLAAALGKEGQEAQLTRIYLIPHGPLHNVPFAALIAVAMDHELGLPVPTVIHAPSLMLLANHLRSEGSASGQQAATLAVSHAGPGQQLRYTAAEAALVAALTGGQLWVDGGVVDSGQSDSGQWGSGAVVAGKRRDALAAIVPTLTWLHLACHGWFDPDRPLASYLEVGEGERLTAQEILERWRLQAQLVTLSACQSGVNRILRGDEPMGLIRALLAVGAQMVLATQWPVADLPTYLLMGHFYRQLVGTAQTKQETNPNGEDNRDPAAALHAAQQWLRRLTRTEVHASYTSWQEHSGFTPALDIGADLPAGEHPFAAPQYWAGFTLFVG